MCAEAEPELNAAAGDHTVADAESGKPKPDAEIASGALATTTGPAGVGHKGVGSDTDSASDEAARGDDDPPARRHWSPLRIGLLVGLAFGLANVTAAMVILLVVATDPMQPPPKELRPVVEVITSFPHAVAKELGLAAGAGGGLAYTLVYMLLVFLEAFVVGFALVAAWAFARRATRPAWGETGRASR